MQKLNIKQKNWLLSAHIASAGIWLGTGLCLVAIAWSNLSSVEANGLHAINRSMKLLDTLVVVPSAIASLITGALLCGLTIWGFTKHYWVIAKWIATVALMVIGTIWLGPWVDAMTAISKVERLRALQNPLYMFDQTAVIIVGAIEVIGLLSIVAISVLKPWGRRNTKRWL